MPYNAENITLAYNSKNNFKRENQVILLMITDGKKWHYLAVKSLSALFRGITSKHVEDFYCLNCFHSYKTENKLKKHEKVCNDDDYCYGEMPNEDYKILKYNYGKNSLKLPAVIYADFECLLQQMHSWQNNLEKSYTEKKLNILLVGYSIFISCSFDPTKNKLDCYEGEHCMKSFCKDLREHAMKVINYEKKRNDTTDRWRK